MTESYGFLLADNGGQGAQSLPLKAVVKVLRTYNCFKRGFKEVDRLLKTKYNSCDHKRC